jgi:two-component system cell cycle sensor histidine kinase/response regulator CckA
MAEEHFRRDQSKSSQPEPDAARTSLESSLTDKHMRTILDTAMDGIISLNNDQEIILFNRAAEIIFGWSAEQVMGRPIDILIPERFVPGHRSYVEQFGQGLHQNRRMGLQRTVLALHADGHEFPIESSISQMKIDQGHIYTVILRDATEAVRRRHQVEEQSQMLNQVSDAVSIVDAAGLITFWNRGAENLFGWTADEAIGKNEEDLLFCGVGKIPARVIHETHENGTWSGEITKTTRGGISLVVDHRRTILKDESGHVKGYLCIDIDLTHRKKQDRQSLRSQRLESIGTLAGGVAHDLNNVLTPIMMGAKLLASNRSPENRQSLLDTLVASAQRGAGLIRQLLAFAGGIQGERQSIVIKQLVNETRGLLEHTLPKSIRIETRVSDRCPLVMGDPTELAQILMNLCINARDAMVNGGDMVIQADAIRFSSNSTLPHPDAKPGLYLVLRVSDTGSGMTTEVLDRIFDPFFTTKETGKGTGLGLATVQGIVKSHQGFVLVYSELNAGSTFSVYLPAVPFSDAKTPEKPENSIQPGNGQLILLIDDETEILQVIKPLLESNGYRVLAAPDGLAGLALMAQHRGDVSVILLDMMMPGMDGFETLAKLREIDPVARVIACSGLRTSQREAKAIAAGAWGFLAKPYTDAQLLESLTRVIHASN